MLRVTGGGAESHSSEGDGRIARFRLHLTIIMNAHCALYGKKL